MITSPSFLPVQPSAGSLQPLGTHRITIDGGFWGTRQELNNSSIIPHCLSWEVRAGWIENFRHAHEGTIARHRTGREFADSDVYKLIEAMAWEVGRTGDVELEAEIERLGGLIEAIQDDDGYVNTRYGNTGQEPRYSDFEWGHELYCFGHLIQAAIARLRTGKDDSAIVRVALKAADHVCETFGAAGRPEICGHPEIEVALAELGRETGENRYIEQARLFIDRRGHGALADIEFGRSYYQDDEPFRDAEVLRGHAVRALYLCAAAVDVGVERGDAELLEAAQRQFDAALARRTYLTGGMGSHHQDEAFGADFELPPDRSYCETCAGIGAVMVAWRLLLATAEERYADVIERCLYNVVAASPSEDGNAFFYANPLHQRSLATEADPDNVSKRASSSLRESWFEVSCCPTNLARTFASLAGLIATTSEQGVHLHQYASATIHAGLASGDVTVRVSTNYPDDGRIRVEVLEANAPFDLSLRVPGWADGATVDGVPVAPGTHTVSGVISSQVVELLIPVHPRLTFPDPRIDAVRGCVAVERGPRVLCVESVDLRDGLSVDDIAVTPGAQPEVRDGEVLIAGHQLTHPAASWAYTAHRPRVSGEHLELILRPYHAWGNRGPTTMRVWLPVAEA